MNKSILTAFKSVSMLLICTGISARAADTTLTLQAPQSNPELKCAFVAPASLSPPRDVQLSKVFEDTFKKHPLDGARWTPYLAGSAQWPDALNWGGMNSQKKRSLGGNNGNTGHELYVDPKYTGAGRKPLGLDPFSVSDGRLSIIARNTPAEVSDDLFGYRYISGAITSQHLFSAVNGYFEIEAKVPFGNAVWPAFWLLADDGGSPPEIDVFEGRGQKPGTLAMSIHWKDPSGASKGCGLDKSVPDAATAFHTYGVLWEAEHVTYFIDRKAVVEIKTPPGFDKKMHVIANIGIGSDMGSVGHIDATTPEVVKMDINRISIYEINSIK